MVSVNNAFNMALSAVKKMSEKSGDALGNVTKAEKAKQAKQNTQQAQAKKTTSKPSDNAFQEQIPKFTKKLFGKRVTKVANLIKQFVPDATLYKVSDKAFLQIALLAEKWSKMADTDDIIKASEFFDTMSNQEKSDVVNAIASRHRAIAALGSGVTGATGFVGILFDLFWLLLLSLRLVYQTAAAYGQPLSGIDGANKVFDILANADLSMLTEKQAVLMSIGAASELVDDIDLQVLQGLVEGNEDFEFFKSAIESITEQFNIGLNFDWLLKFLPVASGLTSAVYSVFIINEVAAAVEAEYSEVNTKTKLIEKANPSA